MTDRVRYVLGSARKPDSLSGWRGNKIDLPREAKMSKLMDLKEWLTVAETAKYLTSEFGEDVTEADVFRLALNGRLRLSVHFINYAKARYADFISLGRWQRYYDMNGNLIRETVHKSAKDFELIFKKCKYLCFKYTIDPEPGTGYCHQMGGDLDISKLLRLSDKVETLRGVFDLPLIGNERLDIERTYQKLTGGSPVNARNLGGAIVIGRNGRMYQLQEHYEEIELLNNEQHNKNNYRPAGSLPTDAVIVLRVESLNEFDELLGNEELIDTIISRVEANKLRRGVSLDKLKLYSWPLDGKNRDESLVNALRRSAWVKQAVVCKDPLTVNPALLAYALQDKSKSKQTGFFIPAKKLSNHLAENFPEYFDEYEDLIEFEKNL